MNNFTALELNLMFMIGVAVLGVLGYNIPKLWSKMGGWFGAKERRHQEILDALSLLNDLRLNTGSTLNAVQGLNISAIDQSTQILFAIQAMDEKHLNLLAKIQEVQEGHARRVKDRFAVDMTSQILAEERQRQYEEARAKADEFNAQWQNAVLHELKGLGINIATTQAESKAALNHQAERIYGQVGEIHHRLGMMQVLEAQLKQVVAKLEEVREYAWEGNKILTDQADGIVTKVESANEARFNQLVTTLGNIRQALCDVPDIIIQNHNRVQTLMETSASERFDRIGEIVAANVEKLGSVLGPPITDLVNSNEEFRKLLVGRDEELSGLSPMENDPVAREAFIQEKMAQGASRGAAQTELEMEEVAYRKSFREALDTGYSQYGEFSGQHEDHIHLT